MSEIVEFERFVKEMDGYLDQLSELVLIGNTSGGLTKAQAKELSDLYYKMNDSYDVAAAMIRMFKGEADPRDGILAEEVRRQNEWNEFVDKLASELKERMPR